MTILVLIGMVYVIFREIFASAAAREFCEWVYYGIELYIPHRKNQVKPHSSPWFLAASSTAMVYRNHFIYFYQQNKSIF